MHNYDPPQTCDVLLGLRAMCTAADRRIREGCNTDVLRVAAYIRYEGNLDLEPGANDPAMSGPRIK